MTDHLTWINSAIVTLRKEGYDGVHTVYSGFNKYFRMQFPKDDVIAVTKGLSDAGKLRVFPARGGAMLYRLEDRPLDKAKTAGNSADAKRKADHDQEVLRAIMAQGTTVRKAPTKGATAGK